tara:strand:- start:40033 stop:41073 length:1041 start_codon:yes stop_codon:yes gene_type:complete
MGVLADIVSNMKSREGLPSVGDDFMDNFKNTSRFTTEDLITAKAPNQMPIPDQLGLNARQRETFGSNFFANRPAPVPTPEPTTDPLTESLTGKETMYGVPGAASAAVNMGGSLSGGGLGSFQAPISARDMFVTDQAQSYEKSFEIDPEQDQVPSGTTLAPMPTKFSGVGPGVQFDPDAPPPERVDSATFNAQMEASRRNDLASAMQTLYGAAGSSFESGRNEYTESGQYDIDKAIRDAEFDAMRAGNTPLTREETARRLAELQASIGFGGAMAPANAPMSTRVEPNPIPTNFELVSGYNVPAPVTGLPSMSSASETTMSPIERNRRARLGRGRMMMNYGGIATLGL